MASLLKVSISNWVWQLIPITPALMSPNQENCDFETNQRSIIRLFQKKKEKVRHGGTCRNPSTW